MTDYVGFPPVAQRCSGCVALEAARAQDQREVAAERRLANELSLLQAVAEAADNLSKGRETLTIGGWREFHDALAAWRKG